MAADVLVCSDHPEASQATVALVDRIEGLRGIDAGSLSQAAAVEAFTAADPYQLAGVFARVEVRAWKVTVGALA